MKILSITLENINSLKGKFTIPLEDLLKTNAPVFAITGPTGSGKTSILDAICAALYGRTPRLPKPSDMAELMTHHTAQCMAEVTFAINEKRYRSRYERHRAKKKATGRLQDASMELVDLTTDQIISSSRSGVPREVEQITGLDFNRFCKSIMLAQGNFDAFLKAGRNERALLLEKITGTEIYAQISTTAFEKNKAEQEALTSIRTRIKDLKLLSSEEIQHIEEEMANTSQTIQAIQATQKNLTASKAFYKELDDTEQIKTQYLKDLIVLEKEEETALPDLRRLKNAKKTIPHLNDFQALDQTVNLLGELADQKTDLEKRIQKERSALGTAEKRQTAIKVQFDTVKKEHDTKQEIIAAVRAQLPLMKDKLEQQKKLRAEASTQQHQIRVLEQEIETGQKQRIRHQKNRERIEQELNGIDTRKAELEGQRKAILGDGCLEDMESKHSENQDRLIRLQVKETLLKQMEQLQSGLKKNTTLKTEKQNSLRDMNQQISHLQKDGAELKKGLALLNQQRELEIKIQDFQAHRAELTDGEPCPLCGSTDHPFQDAPPQPSKVSLTITQYEKELDDTTRQCLSLEKEAAAIDSDLVHLKKEGQTIQNEIDQIGNQLPDVSLPDLESLLVNAKAIAQKSEKHLSLLKKILTDLYAIDQRLQKKQEERRMADLTLQKTMAELDGFRIKTDALKKENQSLSDQLDLLSSELRQILDSAEGLDRLADLGISSGASDPVQLENQINRLDKDLASTLQNKTRQVDAEAEWAEKIRKKLTELVSAEKQCIDQIKKKTQLHQIQSQTFLAAIQNDGFADLDQFRSFLISSEQLSALEQRQAELTKKRVRLETVKEENEKKRQVLETLKDDHPQRDQLYQAFDQAEAGLATANKEMAALEFKITDNRQRIAHHQDLIQQEQMQVRECETWALLNELIGQKDGARFRLFAQDLTLEQLIQKANQYLALFNNRYILEKNKTVELELMVIDTYFADRIRPMENLSGGETFLISLSLALGLSDITSRQAQIESLFLDEGFGTLDKDTLEVALAAIDTLNASGKTVCIISHVESLKERIFLKIDVSPASDGTSRILIPGNQSEIMI